MQTAAGTVVALHAGDRAVVEVSRLEACPRCAAGRGCGAALFGARRGASRVDARIAAGVALAVGDRVSLALAPARLFDAARLAYGLPLAGAAAGAAVAFGAGAGDPAAAALTAAGLALGVAIARRRLGRPGCLGRYLPTVLARQPAAGDA